MRTKPALLLLMALGGACFAQERTFLFEKLPPEDAVVLETIPDGSLPAATPPPKPPEFQIQRSQTHQLPGRKVTIHRVTEPERVKTEPAQVAPPSVEEAAALKTFDWTFEIAISLSATVYDHQWTFLHWRHDERDYYAWSNIDFNHLSVSSFEVKGQRYALYLGLGNETAESLQEIAAKIPPLSRDRPGFVMVDGPPPWVSVPLVAPRQADAEVPALQAITALHALYANEGARLQDAYVQRERAEQARRAWLEANPPKPKDTVEYYWRVRKGARR